MNEIQPTPISMEYTTVPAQPKLHEGQSLSGVVSTEASVLIGAALVLSAGIARYLEVIDRRRNRGINGI